MTRSLALGGALVLVATALAPPGLAQQRGGLRASRSPDGDFEFSVNANAARDTRSTGPDPAPRPYTRTPPARPRPVVEPREAPPRTLHSYFPGTRPNQSPNRNAVNTRTLCNPGRRALLGR